MVLFLSLLSIVLALIMLRYNWKINRNTLFLSLLIILIASAQTRHYLMLHSTDPFWLALLINSPTALWSMTGACLFFYVRSVLTDRMVFRTSDLLHTIPFWFNLVGTLPYIFTPFSYKIEVANLFIHNMEAAKEVRFNWLLNNEWNLLSRHAIQIAYAIACLWMLASFRRRRRLDPNRPMVQGGMIYKWLLAVSVFVLLTGLYYFLGNYFYFRSPSLEREMVSHYRELYISGGLLTCIPSLVLAFPELLYGIPRSRDARNGIHTLSVSPAQNPETDSGTAPASPDASTDTPDLPMAAEEDPFGELGQRVLDFMEREKPFLNPNFSMDDLAEMLAVPKHHLYYCFKNILKTKFVNLRNDFRVRDVKRRLLESDLKETTLEAIGSACGFASQSAFYRIFTEHTGCSPGEYIKKQKGEV